MQGIHPGFETQGIHHQKSKTGVSEALRKTTYVLHKFFERSFLIKIILNTLLHNTGLSNIHIMNRLHH